MSESKKTFLLVHGASRYSRPNLIEKWVPPLEAALGGAWDIVLPKMPAPEAPDAEAWLQAIAEAVEGVKGRACLVGHSLGGSVLLQYVARKMPTQECVFVVAAPFWCGTDSDWQHEPFKLTDRDIEVLRSCRIALYHGTADDIVPFCHLSEYQQAFPQASARSYEGMNHIDPSDTFLRDLASDASLAMTR